jgi:ATP-dependent DNA helicase RecQ
MRIPGDRLDSALGQFGLTSFRPGQREVIEAIVSGDDCLCVMPTGGGKSLCYQLPSVIRPGLTIVVSPLIALMKDQVDGLGKRGIPAALINSTLSQSEQDQRLQDVASGKFQLVYVAPERLRNGRFLEAIRATPIQLLAIDEAHCISQWGHDFRPDYARIGNFRDWLGGVQTVALTATATPRVREDIVSVLRLNRPKQFMSGFARPNLHFGVVQRSSDREKDMELETFLRRASGSGIIYAATRKRCEALVEWISTKLKISVGAYHAGLLPDQRRAVQERFMKNELRVIVATNAFGMGIDKPDLRFVVHFNMPGSLEAYYQEAGRAGRDGKQSQCVMLYSFQDRYIQEFFIDNNYPARAVIESTYEFLQTREEDPIELTLEEIRDALGLSVSPEAIGSSLQILSRTGVIERLERGGGLAMVKLDSDLPTLVDLLPREAKVRRSVMRMLERAVGDRRGEQVFVHPRWLLQESGLEREALARALRELCKLEGVVYVPPFRGRAVHVTRKGIPFQELEIDFEALNKRKEAEYDRLNQVVSYAQSPLCRQATILKYFGDTSADNCGQCDRCGRQPGWPKMQLVEDPTATEPASQTEVSANSANLARRDAAQQPMPVPPSNSLPRISPSKPPDVDSKSHAAQPAAELAIVLLNEVVDAIQRIHGRIGKILLAQYLCGSQNAKIQKLNLHRLGGFGLLVGFRQSDGVELIDHLLSSGLLRQEEVNRNRPTVSISPELADEGQRREWIKSLQLPSALQSKLAAIVRRRSTANRVNPAAVNSPTVDSANESPRFQSSAPASTPASAAPAEVGASGNDQLSSKHGSTSLPEWHWTIEMFRAGYAWSEVQSIRRMSDEELASSLGEALRAGSKLERQWLAVHDEQLRSPGQQRLIREIRRRAAAGVV